MKVYICSDLHCEFQGDEGRKLIAHDLPDADIVIVAGDLAVGEGIQTSLQMLAEKYRQVIYVAGNHEYYNSSLEAVEARRRNLDIKNVHWLENDVVDIEGVQFVGCTLWFGWHHEDIEHQLSDFQVIEGFRKWVHRKNADSMRFLDKHITKDSIVVTHHLPSNQSLAQHYRGSRMNCFFLCAEAEDVLLNRAPRLWIHGHTHHSFDYRQGATRVICNPYGYVGIEVNPAFKTDALVIEV